MLAGSATLFQLVPAYRRSNRLAVSPVDIYLSRAFEAIAQSYGEFGLIRLSELAARWRKATYVKRESANAPWNNPSSGTLATHTGWKPHNAEHARTTITHTRLFLESDKTPLNRGEVGVRSATAAQRVSFQGGSEREVVQPPQAITGESIPPSL